MQNTNVLFNPFTINPSTRRIRKSYHRFLCGRSFVGKYKLLTLTTPPNFQTNLHHAWRMFIQKLRRANLDREYFCVKEFNKSHNLVHLHVAIRSDWIDFNIFRSYWMQVTGASWIDIESIYSPKGMMRYLAKYMTKASNDFPGQRSYWYSYSWICRKAIAYSKSMYQLRLNVSDIMFEELHRIKDRTSLIFTMNINMLTRLADIIEHGHFNELEKIPCPF